MDIARPDQSKAKRRKRIVYGSIAGLVLIGITVVLVGTVLLLRFRAVSARRKVRREARAA